MRENKFLPKKVRELLHCQMCSGFWIGLILSLFIFGVSWMVILYGFAGSWAAWLNHNVSVALNPKEYAK